MAPKRKQQPSQAMTSGGAAKATVNSQNNYVRIANLFLAYIKEVSPDLSAKWKTDWEAVAEKYAADKEIYEHLATYVSSVYTIKDGDKNESRNLSSKVAQQTWSGLIQHQQRRFGKSTDAATKVCRARVAVSPSDLCSVLTSCAFSLRQTFFECLKGDQQTPEGAWWLGIRKKMNREAFQAEMFGPDRMDQTPNELFAQHVVAIVEALSKVNTAEAAERKLAVITLWRMAGRAGEPAFLSFEGLQWNRLHGTPCMECPQSKPSKLKFVPFVAGADRYPNPNPNPNCK